MNSNTKGASRSLSIRMFEPRKTRKARGLSEKLCFRQVSKSFLIRNCFAFVSFVGFVAPTVPFS